VKESIEVESRLLSRDPKDLQRGRSLLGKALGRRAHLALAVCIGSIVVVFALTVSSVVFAFSSVPSCSSDADCSRDGQCATSNVSGRSRCITSDDLIDRIPAVSPLLDTPCFSTSSCPAGYRCGGLQVGFCSTSRTALCSLDSDCQGGSCVGSCVSASTCTSDADCVTGGTCSSLINPPGTSRCVGQTSCNTSSPCPSGFSCTFQPKPGRCEVATTKCESDSDCLANWHCHLSWAAARVTTGACLPNH
jgi:hypothetical protein